VHRYSLARYLAAVVLVGALVAGPVVGAVLDIPFDFSRSAIGIDVTVHGIPLFVILDTGVDPSVIASARAESLGLKVDRASGGEASGYGESKSATVYPTTIDGLAIRGRPFAPIDALMADTTAMSRGYGRDIDGVLGYSFFKGQDRTDQLCRAKSMDSGSGSRCWSSGTTLSYTLEYGNAVP
jgi:hypothetical protein